MSDMVNADIIKKGILYLLAEWKRGGTEPISVDDSAKLLADFINLEVEKEGAKSHKGRIS